MEISNQVKVQHKSKVLPVSQVINWFEFFFSFLFVCFLSHLFIWLRFHRLFICWFLLFGFELLLLPHVMFICRHCRRRCRRCCHRHCRHHYPTFLLANILFFNLAQLNSNQNKWAHHFFLSLERVLERKFTLNSPIENIQVYQAKLITRKISKQTKSTVNGSNCKYFIKKQHIQSN